MRIKKRLFIFLFLLIRSGMAIALDLSDPYAYVTGLFDQFIDPNEGRTTFRSLLIPGGGRAEAMGMAFTALANDISFFETNPSGSATMKNTELSFFHNSWIADSRVETVSFTQRQDNLGYGASIRCFYVPFTEYNTFGERVSRGYYTETLATFNVSYNFLAGYYFKGLAVGANLKTGFRGVPDYSDLNGNLKTGSGFAQSSLTIMADLGLQTRFNFLKLYRARDPNCSVGLSFRNFGPPVQGEPLPSLITGGAAWKPANPITVSIELQKPINLVNPAESGTFVYGAGVSVTMASFFTFLGGFQLKGGNPRISIGGETNVNDFQINVNYTLDMTTQASILNRVSLAAKINMGDRGRLEKQKRIERLYIEGLKVYADGRLEEAIEMWKEVLSLDKRFDPAAEGIAAATRTLDIQKRIRDLQKLE
jgi:Uncharacterised protein family (UPF0164)